MSITEKNQGEQSLPHTTWERSMYNTIQNVLEILEENVNWWEQAATTCEHTAARLPTGEKEGWELMGAVYRERAEKHARLFEQLRQATNGGSASQAS
jgi:hypothetical protein